MEKDTEDYVMQLEKRVVLLEGRVSLLEAQLNAMKPMPAHPSYPAPWSQGTTHCAKCGMKLQGAMGYVCNDQYCPTFPHAYAKTQNFGTVWAGQKLETHLNTQDIKPYNPMSRGDLEL